MGSGRGEGGLLDGFEGRKYFDGNFETMTLLEKPGNQKDYAMMGVRRKLQLHHLLGDDVYK